MIISPSSSLIATLPAASQPLHHSTRQSDTHPNREPSLKKGLGLIIATHSYQSTKNKEKQRTPPHGATQITTQRANYPLKLLFLPPNYHHANGFRVGYFITYGGGMVHGDQIKMDILVNQHAKLCLITQGSSKIYKSPSYRVNHNSPISVLASSRMNQSIRVAPGASFALLPGPVQLFRAAAYSQTVDVHLADASSSVCLLDWYSSGRSSDRERWDLARYESKTRIWMGSRGDDEGGEGKEGQHRLPFVQQMVSLCDPCLSGEGKEGIAALDLPTRMRHFDVMCTLIIIGKKEQPIRTSTTTSCAVDDEECDHHHCLSSVVEEILSAAQSKTTQLPEDLQKAAHHHNNINNVSSSPSHHLKHHLQPPSSSSAPPLIHSISPIFLEGDALHQQQHYHHPPIGCVVRLGAAHVHLVVDFLKEIAPSLEKVVGHDIWAPY